MHGMLCISRVEDSAKQSSETRVFIDKLTHVAAVVYILEWRSIDVDNVQELQSKNQQQKKTKQV